MYGDHSRTTFDPTRGFTSVRMQQGRVNVDADWNEQADINRHLVSQVVRDLIGDGAAPELHAGFRVKVAGGAPAGDGPDLILGAGRLYVDGMTCELAGDFPLNLGSRGVHHGSAEVNSGTQFLIYLTVWERTVNQVTDPSLVEPALNGADTTTRTQVAWKARLAEIVPSTDESTDPLEALPVEPERRQMRVRLASPEEGGVMPPTGLYRVEVHGGGDPASIKWSRDNGSITFPVREVLSVTQPEADDGRGTIELSVEHIERDERLLTTGSWVEWIDTSHSSQRSAGWMFEVLRVDPTEGQVWLSGDADHVEALRQSEGARPFLRRWDSEGAVPIVPEEWQCIDGSLELMFEAEGTLRPGDHWTFPIRDEAGLQWTPADPWERKPCPSSRPPEGPRVSYSPLAVVRETMDGWTVEKDLRAIVPPLGKVQRAVRAELDRQEKRIQELEADLDAVKRARNRQVLVGEGEMTVGSVVAIHPTDTSRIVLAAKKNAEHVIGVIERELSSEGDERRFLVITGGLAQVAVRGRVRAGRLLVPNFPAGYAVEGPIYMRPGTIIGKALEARAKGLGPGLIFAAVQLS